MKSLHRWRTILHILFLLGISGSWVSLDAQDIRRDTLTAIDVTATRYTIAAIKQPVYVQFLDADDLKRSTARDLAGLLSMYGHAHIRSYGPGLSAGITQRGFSTSSFQVIRDGFAINHPMHGQVDIGLIPIASLLKTESASGNASSTYGSSASGGSLLIRSSWDLKPQLAHSRGAYGFQETNLSAGANLSGNLVLLQGGYSTSANDFGYYNIVEEQSQRRLNNQTEQFWGRIGSLSTIAGLNVQSNVYWNDAERGVPNPIIAGNSAALQQDSDLRYTASIRPDRPNSNWAVNVQAYQNILLYDDDFLTETSYNRIRSASLAAELTIVDTNSVQIDLHVGTDYAVVKTSNYDSNPARLSAHSILQGRFSLNQGLILFPSVRVDIIEDVGSALSPTIGLNQAIIPGILHLRSQLSRNFTAPSMNDLYWAQGGNPDLKPEIATKFDIGAHASFKMDRINLDVQGGYFLSRMRNGIIWQPGPQNIWSPINLVRMNSHGSEQSLKATYSGQSMHFGVSGSATYVHAQIPAPRFDGDNAVNRQLRYTPSWILRGTGFIAYKKTELAAEYSFDGERYTTEDHSSPLDPLPAYNVVNLILRFSPQIGPTQLGLKLSILNLTDEQYNSIAWYPMPGRHIQIGMNIALNR